MVSEAAVDVPDIDQPILLGRGGCATVYRALDLLADRPVAVKVLSQRPDDDTLRYFERERVALARLSTHPNVVTLHRTGVTGAGHPYLVLESAPGGSLADRVNAGGPLPWREAVEWILPICDAVEHAHGLGIQHRDIKPQNILISAHDQPLLSDFGIATLTSANEPAGSGSATRPAPGTRLSPSYASPEQLVGGPVDASTDVYSLAATLYALIAGRTPPAGPPTGGPSPTLDPSVPTEVGDTIARALAGAPPDRPTIAAFRRSLRRAAEAALPPGHGVLDDTTREPAGPPPRTEAALLAAAPPGPGSALRDRPLLAGSLAIAGLLVVGGLIALTWSGRGGDADDGVAAGDPQGSEIGGEAVDRDGPAPLSPVGADGVIDADGDGDGVADDDDNCPVVSNPDQFDTDGDGEGDDCDADDDDDGLIDQADNCPADANQGQDDVDRDGLGDACDDFPDRDRDGVIDTEDPCIEEPGAPDTDGDGTPDECDASPRGMVATAASVEVVRVTVIDTVDDDDTPDLFGDLTLDETRIDLPLIPDQREVRPSNWYSDRIPVDAGAPVVRIRVRLRDDDSCFLCRDDPVDSSPLPGADALHLVIDTGTGAVEVADESWARSGVVGMLTGSDDGDLTGTIVQEGDDTGMHRASIEVRLTLVRAPRP